MKLRSNKAATAAAATAAAAALALSLAGCGVSVTQKAPDSGSQSGQTSAIEQGQDEVVDDEVENSDNVTISSCSLQRDYEGKKRAVVTFEWTNNTGESTSFYDIYTVTAYQDGSEIDRTFGKGDAWHDYSKKLKPGKTQTFKMMFESNTKDDVEIEVTNWMTSEVVATKTFTM